MRPPDPPAFRAWAPWWSPPNLTVAELTERLRQRIDSVFLPRPLLIVDTLPRNTTGKLPHHALQELAGRHLQGRFAVNLRVAIEISPHHPSFAGHFPAFPVLPGAVLLDEALRLMQRERGLDLTRWKIASAKFLDVVRPADALSLEHEAAENGSIRFVIRVLDRPVASGTLSSVLPSIAAVSGGSASGALFPDDAAPAVPPRAAPSADTA